MDLSRLSDSDLRALSKNNLRDVSDAGLKLLAADEDTPKARKGLGAALSKGTEATVGGLGTGFKGLFSPEEAAKQGLERSKALNEKYEEQVSLDKLKEAYEKRGFTGAGGELLRQIPLAIAEQAPNIATTVGGARLGAGLGSFFGPVGAGIGALGGAVAPSLLQMFGSNIERQAATQEEAGQPIDISRARALGAAIPQAALETAANVIPLGGRMAGKIFGPEVEKLLARGGTKAAEKLAQEKFATTVGKGLATGAIAEIPTEIAQQVLERAQAGLDLTSPDALKEYGETAYQVGLLAPIGAGGRFIDKSGAKAKIETEKKAQETKLAQEQEAVAQEELLNKQAQDEMAKIAAEQKPVTPTKTSEEAAQMRQEVFNQRSTLERVMDDLRTEASKEADLDKLAELSGRAEQIQKGLDELNPDKVKQEINKLAKDNATLNKQIKALDKAELTEEQQTEKQALVTKLQQNTVRFDTLKDRLPALEPLKQDAGGADVRSKLESKLAAITKARETGDLAAIGKLTKEYKELQAQYQGVQAPLFETTKQGELFYPEDEKRIADEKRAADQKQKDLLDEQALKEAEEKTQLTSPVVEPAAKEDIEAYKQKNAALNTLKTERAKLQDLFNTANSNNDVRGAVDLQKLIEAKDAEIKQASAFQPTEKMSEEQAKQQALETAKPDELIQEIKDLQKLIKKSDDQIKAAAGSTTALAKDGTLTPAGLKLAEIQKQRDQAVADLQTKQANLDAVNASSAKRASEEQQTNLFTEAFPEKEGFVPEKIKTVLSNFRRHVGDNLTVRAELMSLRRELALARSKRNKLGKGANREEIKGIINDMREVIERISETKQDNLLPTDPRQGAETVKYHQAINAAREKQQTSTDKYLASLEAYFNREYFGGETKKAKTTKEGLEKRIDNDAKNLINTMLEEAAINRRVYGLAPLTQEQIQELVDLYKAPIQSLRLYSENNLNAPEKGGAAVIADQFAEITDRASTISSPQKGEFGLRLQFGKPETEEVGTLAKDMGLTVREKEAGKKVDVSNVGNLEQGELFSEQTQKATTKASIAALEKEFAEKEAIVKEENSKKFPDLKRALAARKRGQEIDEELKKLKAEKPQQLLEPIATVRSTPGMFRRLVDSQVSKLKKAKEAIDQLVSKINTSAKKDYESKAAPLLREIESLRLKLENHLGKNDLLGVDASRRNFEKDRLIGGKLYVGKTTNKLKTYDEVTKELQNKIQDLVKQLRNTGQKAISARQDAFRNLEEQQKVLYRLNWSEAYVKELRKTAEALWKTINSETKSNNTTLETLLKRDTPSLSAEEKVQLNKQIEFAQREAVRLQTEKQETLARIDAIYQEAKDLEHSKKNIDVEKTILADLEKIAEKLDGIPKAAKEASDYADKMRAEVAKTEAVQDQTSKQELTKTQEFLERFNLPGIVVKAPDKDRILKLKTEIAVVELKLKKAEGIRPENKTAVQNKNSKILAFQEQLKDLRTDLNVTERVSVSLAPTQNVKDLESRERLKEAREINEAHAHARKLQKQRQAETRRKEALESAQNKWDDFAKQLTELKEKYLSATTKRARTALYKQALDIDNQMRAIVGLKPIEGVEVTKKKEIKTIHKKLGEGKFLSFGYDTRKVTKDGKTVEIKVEKPDVVVIDFGEKGVKNVLLKDTDLPKNLRDLLINAKAQAEKVSQRAVGPATKDVQPAQFKTGVKKYTKGEKQVLKTSTEIVKAVEKSEFSLAKDATVYKESGLTQSEYTAMFSDILNRDVDFRIEETDKNATPLTKVQVVDVLSRIKMPKGLNVLVLNKVPAELKAQFEAMGHDASKVKGWVSPNGTVFIVAENHTSIPDVNETIAHELIGHLGVEALLGEKGMRSLISKIVDQEGGIIELAKKLGIIPEVYGTYHAAKNQGLSEFEAQAAAVRELLAHTAEKEPNKSMTQKAKDFIKLVVAYVRDGLRRLGVKLDVSTSDVYKIIYKARKNFDSITPGAFVNTDGAIKFNVARPKATPAFEGVLNSTKGIVAEQKSWLDRVRGEASGLVFETKYIDRFAPVQKVFQHMKESLMATQVMYFLRMADQRMAFTSEVLSNGPLDLVPAKDGKGFMIESQKGTSFIDVVNALKPANVGDVNATNRVFTLYLLAIRAKDPRIGLAKLNYSGKITQKMLDDAIATVNSDPATKAAFENAAAIYAKYNEGLINFAVKSGAIGKDIADVMLKNKNYVPFYRQKEDGSVMLEIGGAPAIKIGNLADQPYLHELVKGDQPIFDVFTSALQNTSMLTDMALRNIATKNTANALAELGLLDSSKSDKDNGIRKATKDSQGPTGPDIIRFKENGINYWARVKSESADVPSQLLVKGLEGVNTSLPNIVKLMGGFSTTLRKWVTRNPAYNLRQLVRDPLNGVIVAGLDTTPIASSLKEVYKMVRGTSEGEAILGSRGILGGQVLTGTAEDMQLMLKSIMSGEKGWDYRMAQLDMLAVKGDAATRVVMYNNYLKQGLSEIEATLATLESMNFSKRGISSSLFMVSTMVPFMNAQIQGLNVLYKAFTGNMPFNEKLQIKNKLVQRASMLFASSIMYAVMMQDDEAYQNANDDEKYGNWFMYSPFSDEPLKIPIPFEVGFLFKAVPEALVNLMYGDDKARDVGKAIAKQAFNAMPNITPQGIKPAVEALFNYSLFTNREIDSDRMMQYEPGERYNERTTELSKLVGGAFNISPNKIEYLIRGYFGSVPLALASMANPILRTGEGGEQPESRGIASSETPIIGTFFQPKDAGGLINRAYKDMEEIEQFKQTYKKMVAENRMGEAEAYLDANADAISMGSMAGRFRKQMGNLTNQERAIRTDPDMTAGQKREALDEIRQVKIETAKMFSSATE